MADTPHSVPSDNFASSITKDFDFEAMKAKNPEKVGMPINAGMQVRKSLRKFPPLKHVIKDGFDYEGFCKTVDVSDCLTAEGKALAKDVFNPNKRVSSGLTRAGKQATRGYQEMFSSSAEFATDHPIHDTWKEVWNDTKGRFSKEVSEYEAMVAKKNEKRGKTITADKPQYPHAIPQIIHSKAKIANAAMMLAGDNPTLTISEGFLRLPPDQQKAALYHEARHGFEPVMAKIEANKYIWRRLALQGLTLNASSRYNEHKADENAAAFGHAEVLAQSLEHMTESSKPMLREMYGTMGTVAKIATEHGFQIDKKKAVGMLKDSLAKPTTLKKQMLAPIVTLCSNMAVASFDKTMRKFASRDTEQFIEEAMNPKLWGVRIGTHPTTVERVAKLTGQGKREL